MSSEALITNLPFGVKFVHRYNTADALNNFTNIPDCSTVVLAYENRFFNTPIPFSDKICTESGFLGDPPLSLVMDLELNKFGLYYPKFLISSGSAKWDATNGSLTNNPKK